MPLLTEAIARALLQASVTGAGLVLAVYALVVARATEILEERSQLYARLLKLMKKEVAAIGAEDSAQQLTRLRALLELTQAKHGLPFFFGTGILLSFVGYSTSIFLALAWFLLESYQVTIEQWLLVVFGGATLAFLVAGSLSIWDIQSVIKKQYEQLKSEQTKEAAVQEKPLRPARRKEAV